MFSLFGFKKNEDNDESNNFLNCPKCNNEILKIASMKYDDLVNDYIINYQCSHKKEDQKINLKKYLIKQNSNHDTSKEFPLYCPYHEYSSAPFFCPECNDNLCKKCYNEHLLYEQDKEHFNKYYNNKKNCKIHKNKKIINYCKECQERVCSQCIKDIHFSHCEKWADIDDEFYEKFNMKINDRNHKINNFVKNNLNNIEQIIDKANKLKKYILDSYNNYLSNYLPVINLYKLYLFKSNNYYSNDINDMINNFNFDNLYQYVDDLYNSNNYINNKKNIFDDTLSKLNKEIKIIDESLSIYTKGINFIFNKINFTYINKNSSKYIQSGNPFFVSNTPKKYSQCVKELKSHKDEIFCLINLSNGNFASGSGDGLVLIWNDYLLELSLTIHAHNSSVSSLCEAICKNNKNILLTGGNDSTIQLWDINDDYNNIKKLEVNSPIINLFSLSNEVFASFANNQLILWSIETYEKLFSVEISNVYILEYLNDNIFAAGMEDDDNSIMIFNVFDTKMTHKKLLKGNEDIVSCIKKIDQKYIISGDYEGNLMVWDLIKMELFFKIEKAHLYKITSIIQLNSGLFVTCSNDKNIKIWDLHKRLNISAFPNSHEKAIRGVIQLNNGMLVSAGNDSIIKVWN